jgi:hypothetical protein
VDRVEDQVSIRVARIERDMHDVEVVEGVA